MPEKVRSSFFAILFSLIYLFPTGGGITFAQTQPSKVDSLARMQENARFLLQTRPDSALPVILQIRNWGNTHQDTPATISAYLLEASYFDEKGDWTRRLESYQEAYRLAMKIEDHASIIKCLREIAKIHLKVGEHEEARQNLEEAAKLTETLDSTEEKIDVLTDAAMLFARMDSMEKSSEFFDQALTLAREENLQKKIAIILANWGRIEKDNGILTNCLQRFTEALQIVTEQGDFGGQTFINAMISDYYFLTGNPPKSLEFAISAYEMARRHGGLSNIANTASDLSRAYERVGNDSKALEFARIFIRTNDSIQEAALAERLKSQSDHFEVELRLQQEARVKEAQSLRERLGFQQRISIISIGGGIILIFLILLVWKQSTGRRKAIALLEEEIVRRKESEAELNHFLYKASHDLQGPVKSVQGILQLLGAEEVSAENKAELNALLTERVDQMDEMLSRLLEMVSILESERTFSETPLEPIWQEVLTKLEKLPGYANAELNTEFPPHATIQIDPRIARLVLRNLVGNAILFGRDEETSHQITVRFHHSGKQAVLEIADNGMGMNEEAVKRSDEMFYRGSSKSKGSGLGLFLVQKSVKKLGGKVLVNSAEGKGTTVTVSWPES